MSVADDVKTQHVRLFNPVTPDISPPPQIGSGGSSSMRVHEPLQGLDFSSITNADIQEMEQVRGHLHMMLQNCKGFSDQGDYDHAPSTTTADYETQDNDGDKESVVSVDTTALLHRLLPNSSPLSELQVHFQNGQQVLPSHDQSGKHMVSFSGDKRLKGISSGKVTNDKTLLSENSLLRDLVERERFRRKHCEQQIQELHGKLLEVQQQLAVAVSAEQKKDVMIEQLDKTLAKVVEGWKKHEGEKVTIINQLKVERENAEQSQQRQQEMLLQFEKELAQAVEALTKEQEKAARAEKEKQMQLKQQKEERTKLLESLSKEKEAVGHIEKQREEIMKEKAELEEKHAEAEEALKEQTNLIEEQESRIRSLEAEHEESLAREGEKLKQEMQTVKDSQAVLASVQKEVQRLEMDLDSTNREKESLKMELRLMEAKHEANRTKEETERQAELEREMTKRLEEMHDQMAKDESELRDSHRKQLQEMNTKHREDLQQQLAKFHEELKKKDAKLKTVSDEYEERISGYQEKMASLANTQQYLEKERHTLTQRLQKMMKSHCEEALKLLSSSSTKHSPLPEKHKFSYDQWAKSSEGTQQPDKLPITAALFPSSRIQQNQKMSDKPFSSLLPASKPHLHGAIIHDNSQADSGMFSSGSYLSMNGDVDKHGVLSRDQSSLDFYPLRAYIEGDSPKASEDAKESSLLEQTLEPDNTLLSVFPHETQDQRPVTMPAAQDITEKLEEQESRQAELNHYVKMLLQRSPGDQHYEEKSHMAGNGLMLIPSTVEPNGDSHTSSGVISPIHFDRQLEEHASDSLYPSATTLSGVTSTNQPYQDSRHKINPTQAAFTKTTVTNGAFHGPVQTRREVSFASQLPSQPPHSRLTQVAPHTPPRRERDTDDHPPSSGALTPQQVGQLSRMLGLFSGPGQPQFSAEQLYAYLKGVQDKQVTEQTSWSGPHPVSTEGHSTQEQRVSGPGPKSERTSPPQASHRQQIGANKAKRSLDTNFHKRQAQAPHTGGPSITGHPIPPPGGQPTKSTDKSNKQQPRQIASHFGPPLRYQGGPPGVQDGAKPSAKTGQQGKENKKPLPAGKQAKTNAWR